MLRRRDCRRRGIADGLVGIIDPVGAGVVVAVVDLVGQDQRLPADQRLGAVEPVGVGDHIPEAGITPHRLRDGSERIPPLHHIPARGRGVAQPIDRVVALVEVGIGCASGCSIAEGTIAGTCCCVLCDRGRIIDIARPVVRDIAHAHSVKVVMDLLRIALGRSVVALLTGKDLAIHIRDEVHRARPAVLDIDRLQVPALVVVEGRGVVRRAGIVVCERLHCPAPPDERVGARATGLRGAVLGHSCGR